MSEDASLREQYSDLVEMDRRPAGIRYAATLFSGAPVVVHALSRELGARIRDTERFFATLGRAAAVQHDALNRPQAWGQTRDGLFHVAFARLDAEEITPGALSPSDVAAMGVQLARALAAVHSAQLTHGAITTERISEKLGGGAQLNDFGLFAALVSSGVSASDAAAVLSNAPYISPETQGSRISDERSDIYSLGASLFELLTGKPPYGGRTTSYVIASVLSENFDAETRDDLTSSVVEALLRAIESAPDDRWPTASSFANALARGVGTSKAGAADGTRARGCFPVGAASVIVAIGLIVAVAAATDSFVGR
jgi:eukaryotic-like serine/threonine-protein kinase